MQSILGSGRFGSPPRQQRQQPQPQSHSYTSSSEDSYGRVNSYSRSESGTSQTHYEDFLNGSSPKGPMNHNPRGSLDWNLAQPPSGSPQRSMVAPDNIAMHLLLETAVGDSAQFAVLSMEELDQVKKEEAIVARRLPGLQRELQLETKYRDAARSYSRLSDRGGRSGSSKAGPGATPEEYAASARKCEELTSEIFDTERRQRELTDRRLKHTAAVLQMDYEQRSGQAEYRQTNGADSNDGWSAGFNLRQFAPGGLADTFDGIIDLPGGRDTQMDATLHDLWDVVSAHDDSATQNGTRGINGNGVKQDFSLDDFSAKVQSICNQAAHLNQNQKVLQAQLRQEKEQRSLKSSEHAALVQQLQEAHDKHANLVEQLQETHDKHLQSQRKIQDSQADTMELRAYLDQARQEIQFLKAAHTQNLNEERDAEREARKASEQDLLQQLEAWGTRIASLEQSHREAHSNAETAGAQVAAHEATITTLRSSGSLHASKFAELTASLAAAQALNSQHETEAQEITRQASAMEDERAELEAEVVRLQTEVTIARAELDGAYGTRAQRAAEVASNPGVQKDFDDALAKNSELQNELRELVTEHEALVRQGVESERQWEVMENTIDTLRDRVEAQEIRLSEERLKTFGRRGSGTSNAVSTPGTAPATPGAPEREGNATSMSVMRAEFKKMMRDARSEQFKALRAEQDERRRLEGVIRSLRKETGQSSSPLSGATLSPPRPGLRPHTSAS